MSAFGALSPEVELIVDKTWDGLPAEPGEVALVTLKSVDRGWEVSVDAPFHDDPAPPGPSATTEGLWEHEVVELFVAGPNERYLEVELGPHGHWLVLELDGVRTRRGQPAPISYDASIDGARWRGTARFARSLIPPGPHRMNAYAMHGVDPRRYLAHSPVPGDRPDFHRLERFVAVDLGS